MIPVDYEKAGIKVTGYISNLDFSKATRSWQAYVVNGRAVENRDLTLAVDKAYEGKLVKGNYPFCVIDILLPFNEVDINVHPRKSEVRFRNKSSVFSDWCEKSMLHFWLMRCERMSGRGMCVRVRVRVRVRVCVCVCVCKTERQVG